MARREKKSSRKSKVFSFFKNHCAILITRNNISNLLPIPSRSYLLKDLEPKDGELMFLSESGRWKRSNVLARRPSVRQKHQLTILWRYSLKEDARDQIYTLEYGKDKVETTWNHPYRVERPDKTTAWVEARNLQVGDLLLKSDGTRVSLSKSSVSQRQETVYNFEVDVAHTYFVGEESVLVHNDAKCIGGEDYDKLMEELKKDTAAQNLLDDYLRDYLKTGTLAAVPEKMILDIIRKKGGTLTSQDRAEIALRRNVNRIAQAYDLVTSTKDSISFNKMQNERVKLLMNESINTEKARIIRESDQTITALQNEGTKIKQSYIEALADAQVSNADHARVQIQQNDIKIARARAAILAGEGTDVTSYQNQIIALENDNKKQDKVILLDNSLKNNRTIIAQAQEDFGQQMAAIGSMQTQLNNWDKNSIPDPRFFDLPYGMKGINFSDQFGKEIGAITDLGFKFRQYGAAKKGVSGIFSYLHPQVSVLQALAQKSLRDYLEIIKQRRSQAQEE